jgi:RNA polymerase sigma-70 factor (ECF subfamily)
MDAQVNSIETPPGDLALSCCAGVGSDLATSKGSRAHDFEAEALPHVRRLYGAACRLTRNTHDAEDLVQDTLLRAYRAYDSFTPGTNMRAWLFTILYRVRADGFRRAVRSPRTVELVKDTRSVLPPQDALASGGELLESALEQVPVHYRTALVLRVVQDFSYDEIARILEVPIGTVMSRIHRGRSLLRQLLCGQSGRPAQMTH